MWIGSVRNKIVFEIVCFLNENSGTFLIRDKAIIKNKGNEIKLKYLKNSRKFIN